ncbi:TetR/AcrR family transcriptional regulator [Alteromonadaceae bacterium M269]|nr:TetR/AcrR family transcriptional regulator [Alteromonadaceae bacterium M269]
MSRKEHLVKTAQNLFYKQGIRSTGIDTVLAESGVAKKTLYNHFKSKDELIIATLQRRDQQFMDMLRLGTQKYMPAQNGDVRLSRVLAFFDALAEWIASENFSGCMFINASAEYPRQNDPIHVACTNHKRLVIQFIEELLSSGTFKDSYNLARRMALLADGAIVNAHTTNDQNAAKEAKAMALIILESELIP